MTKRLLTAVLLLSLFTCCLSLASCSKEGTSSEWKRPYDPYNSTYSERDPVDTGRKIKVTGKSFNLDDSDDKGGKKVSVIVRDKDTEMHADAGSDLAKLYASLLVTFKDEDTVEFTDLLGVLSEKTVFELSGVREGNVLTLQNKSKDGSYTYEMRIEIHKDKLYIIHNGHFPDEPGTYATIFYELYK